MCFTIVDRVVDAINSCEELDLPLVPALDACEAGDSSMLDEITARFDAVSECRARGTQVSWTASWDSRKVNV